MRNGGGVAVLWQEWGGRGCEWEVVRLRVIVNGEWGMGMIMGLWMGRGMVDNWERGSGEYGMGR